MPDLGILETCIYVDDLAAAQRFYCDVLGLQFVSQQEGRHLFLRCGSRMLLLFDPQQSSDPDGDLPPHGTIGHGHLAFAVRSAELDAWKDRLTRAGVEIECEVQWPSGGRSYYFRDPSGNSLELAMPGIWGIEEEAALQ